MALDPNQHPEHSIAVIGMAGRFPGANNIDEYWCNLREGKESIHHFTEEELRTANLSETVINNPHYVKSRGILKDVEYFDSAFFGLSPREARVLDPQQRVWLECVHEALEDAGYTKQNSKKIVGVFTGARESTYLLNNLCNDRESQERLLNLTNTDAHQIFLTNDRDSIATRTSFLFDFTGPSINVQSACSTSLVSVAQACWSLANYQCDVSIAGGVCVTFPTIRGYFYQEEGIYSPDGHCRAFDAKARGTVFGDGVGAVVLKRLEDALLDGSRIDAIIRGWAVNNDGTDKASFTAPSVHGQAEVIALAQEMAIVDPAQVGYIETHGTGTQIGDPIEVAGLTKAFNRQSHTQQFCGLGSVKTNIGHLDTAAGIAGFIKTILALKHQQIPPSLHFKKPNPQINFSDGPFYVVDCLKEWHQRSGSRLAGVSSFGAGGTNCHIVLEEAPVNGAQVKDRERAVLLTLSAKSEHALADLKSRYQQYLGENHQEQLSDIAFTSNIGRSHYDWRLAVVGTTHAEVCERLGDEHGDSARFKIDPEEGPIIGFLFTGQGSQYSQMARQLYDTEPEFRRTLERCNEMLRSHLDQPLLDVLYSDGNSHTLLDRTDYTQPVLFSMEYALAELWRSWGIEPSCVIGHSLGEYVAACVAGVFSLEDGLRLVAERGRLMNALPCDGGMVSVFADPNRVAEAIQPFSSHVSIAALNAPEHVVISGARESIEVIVAQLQKENIHCRDLQVSHAFHSPLIEPMLVPLEKYVKTLTLNHPSIVFISNLSGGPISNDLTTGAYWREHSRQTVKFANGIQAMARQGCQVFVEIGPHAVLTRFGRDIVSGRDTLWLSSLRRQESNWHSLSKAVGQLYVRGVDIDWLSFNQASHHELVKLPTYPFQRERLWIDTNPSEKVDSILPYPQEHAVGNPMLGERLRLPGSEEVRFETYYSRQSPPYLRDHRLFGKLVVPAASHAAMFVQATESIFPQTGCRFENIVLMKPIQLSENTARYVQLVFSQITQDYCRDFQLVSAEAGVDTSDRETWSVHITGQVRALINSDTPTTLKSVPIRDIQVRARERISGVEFYANVWGNKDGTGEAFKWINSIWKGQGEALAKTECPLAANDGFEYRVHPGLFEACFQVLHCGKTFETAETIERDGVIYVPFTIDEISYYVGNSDIREIWSYAKLRDFHPDNVVADLYLCDQFGQIIVEIIGLCLRKLSRASVIESSASDLQTLTLQEREGSARFGEGFQGEDPKSLLTGLASRSSKEQRSMLLTYMQQQAMDVSGFPKSKIDLNSSLVLQGFDSLMAIMLGNRIKSDLSVKLPIAKLLSNCTLQDLSDELLQLWIEENM